MTFGNFAIKYNFDYPAIHVEGKCNPKADALSRFWSQVSEPYAKTQT